MKNISDNFSCPCGYPMDNEEHFLFRCNKFRYQRLKRLRDLRYLHSLNVKLLKFGTELLGYKISTEIFIFFSELHKRYQKI